MTSARTVPPLQKALGFIQRVFNFAPRLEETQPDDARSRREFIWEVLSRNPDAFSSDADVQSMMSMYPGRF
ncbi:hypothetical protein [Pseudophaeobacter flagellatus]|uniref:hypothetical protein n=1 Tax=Pseudophaeobacter flagellatus TaxID=2899119 RepID=UPI001E3362CD|nr:hypothetical protein [Pseudophaeobacter flagellatus]